MQLKKRKSDQLEGAEKKEQLSLVCVSEKGFQSFLDVPVCTIISSQIYIY